MFKLKSWRGEKGLIKHARREARRLIRKDLDRIQDTWKELEQATENRDADKVQEAAFKLINKDYPKFFDRIESIFQEGLIKEEHKHITNIYNITVILEELKEQAQNKGLQSIVQLIEEDKNKLKEIRKEIRRVLQKRALNSFERLSNEQKPFTASGEEEDEIVLARNIRGFVKKLVGPEKDIAKREDRAEDIIRKIDISSVESEEDIKEVKKKLEKAKKDLDKLHKSIVKERKLENWLIFYITMDLYEYIGGSDLPKLIQKIYQLHEEKGFPKPHIENVRQEYAKVIQQVKQLAGEMEKLTRDALGDLKRHT